MTKKHYIQMAICALLVLICIVLVNYYYQTYIAPESFVIGSVQLEDYKTLPIKDYLSDDEVIFSQNINDVTFSSVDGTSIYEYNFDAKDFNGEEKDYLIYVNDYMINNLVENAGTVGGTHNLNYYDVEKQVLCSSAINIDFSFYSLKSKLKVTLNSDDLGYLMNYFKTDNFIITLTENPFIMNIKDVVAEVPDVEVPGTEDELADITATIKSVKTVSVDYQGSIQEYSPDGTFATPVEVATYTTKSTDSIALSFSTINATLSVDTDGTYTNGYGGDTGYFTVSWENATFIVISIEKTSSDSNYT